MDKKSLSERDICTKFITPAIVKAGWDTQKQVLEEVSFTDGKIYVRGRLTARGKRKQADYILYHKSNIPIAIIEAKDNNHSERAGIQQALDYARILDIPCVFSSNGDGFIFHDRTATGPTIETELGLDEFPSPLLISGMLQTCSQTLKPHQPSVRTPDGAPMPSREPVPKVYVNGVDVTILVSRELYFDKHGKPITTSLKDHTREIITGQYATLDDFLNKWNSADKKTVLIEELKQQGVLVEALYQTA